MIYGTGPGPAPLTLLGATPEFGSIRGGTEVILRGSGFAGAVSVLFGGNLALRVDLVSTSEIHSVSPPAPGPGKVDITLTINGESRRLAGSFEYIEPLPRIDLGNPGNGGVTVLGDGKLQVGRSVALGDLTGDGIAELALALVPDASEPSWSVALLHGGTRRTGTVDLSKPAPGVTSIDVSATGNGGHVGMVGDVNGDGLGDLGLGATGAKAVILFGRREFPPSIDIAAEVAAGRPGRRRSISRAPRPSWAACAANHLGREAGAERNWARP